MEKDEDLVKGFLESAPDAIVIVDREGEIRIVNFQAEKLFGYTRDEIMGREVEVLMPSKYRNVHRLHRQKFSACPKARVMGKGMELFGQHKDGRIFPIAVRVSKLEAEEGFFIAATIRDVSYEKTLKRH